MKGLTCTTDGWRKGGNAGRSYRPLQIKEGEKRLTQTHKPRKGVAQPRRLGKQKMLKEPLK